MQLGGRKWEIRIVVPKVIDRRAELTCQRPGFVDGQRSHPGALTVHEVRPGLVRATCQGDSGRLHRCCWWRGSFGCSCTAGQFRADCAHLRALRLVVAEPAPDEPADLTAEQLRREQDEANRVGNGARWLA
jgi:hypothetical protein